MLATSKISMNEKHKSVSRLEIQRAALQALQELAQREVRIRSLKLSKPLHNDRRWGGNNFIDLTGMRFGRWTVLALDPERRGKDPKWRCVLPRACSEPNPDDWPWTRI